MEPGHGHQDGARAQTAPADVTLLTLSHVRRAPKWSFHGRHAPQQNLDGPGPGAYQAPSPENTSRFAASPRFGFGVSGRDTMSKAKVPGPGAYSADRGIIGSGVAFSLTPRRTAKGPMRKDVPGPGAHEIRTVIGQGPKYSASPRYAELRRAQQPGPGDYDQVDHMTAEKTPRWGFGTSQRPETAGGTQAGTPGPGTYGLGSSVGEGPKFSMKARLPAARPQPSPGPGAHGGPYTSFSRPLDP